MARATAISSVTSPTTTSTADGSTPSGVRARSTPASPRARIRTRWPIRTSAATECAPTKPVPPVTHTSIGHLRTVHDWATRHRARPRPTPSSPTMRSGTSLTCHGTIDRECPARYTPVVPLVPPVVFVEHVAETVRRPGRWRLWMAAAMASLSIGMSAWIWGQLIVGVALPTTTLAPVGFIMVPVLTLFGVLTLVHDEPSQRPEPAGRRRSRLLLGLDALIILGSV